MKDGKGSFVFWLEVRGVFAGVAIARPCGSACALLNRFGSAVLVFNSAFEPKLQRSRSNFNVFPTNFRACDHIFSDPWTVQWFGHLVRRF